MRQHQWFLHKLPAYLALPPEMIELQERHMDQEIVLKGTVGVITDIILILFLFLFSFSFLSWKSEDFALRYSLLLPVT